MSAKMDLSGISDEEEVDWGDEGDDNLEGFGEDDGGGWDDVVESNDLDDCKPSESMPEEQKGIRCSEMDRSFQFASKAFGMLPARLKPEKFKKLSTNMLNRLMVESVPGVKKMISTTRNAIPVMDMLCQIYETGLFTLGGPSSAVNQQVIPGLHYVFHVCSGLDAGHPKRKYLMRTLTDAMNDCQQVQAREILRLYGDLTNQNQTFENQLQYFLLKQKEEALERFIGRYHKDCDQPHTVVKPWQQRAHLKSGYIDMLGYQLGFEAVEAAKSDRFLADVHKEILKGVWGDVDKSIIFKMLCKELSVEKLIMGLISDINNQSEQADRLINRDVIFKWAKDKLTLEEAHKVFWNSDNQAEYNGLNPDRPTEANQFQPFLSIPFLTEILLKMGVIERKSKAVI